MAIVNPKVGFFSEETQKINNWLPLWHAGRRLRTSNWASIVNSLVGEQLDDLRKQQERGFRNLYIQTAHLDELDIIRRVELRANTEFLPKTTEVNKLINGNFALRGRPDKVANYWSHSGTVEIAAGLFGTRSVRLLPAEDETSQISQTITTRDIWGVGDIRTFSCWYRIPTWDGGTIPSDSHGIKATVTYHDGTTETFRQAFQTHTSGQWQRASLTVTADKSIQDWTVLIETKRSASFQITAPVDVDGVQVQEGSNATPWEPHFADKPFWFKSLEILPISVDADCDVFLTNDIRDFHYEAVPTRVDLVTTRTVASDANRGGGISTLTDFDRNRWLAQWIVDTSQNKILLEGIQPQDEYAVMDISLFVGTASGPKFEEGVAGLTYRCATGFGYWLWVVHEMTGLDGNPQVALSICSPRLPFPSPDYIESVYTLPLPIDAGVDYHSIEFRLEDPQHIYISTSSEEYVLRLYYDYGMIDTQTYEMFLKEHYTNIAVVK